MSELIVRRWARFGHDRLYMTTADGSNVGFHDLETDIDAADLATAVMAAVQGGILLSQLRRSSNPLRQATAAAIGYIETFVVPQPTRQNRPRSASSSKPNPRNGMAAPAPSKKQPRRDPSLGDGPRKQKSIA